MLGLPPHGRGGHWKANVPVRFSETTRVGGADDRRVSSVSR